MECAARDSRHVDGRGLRSGNHRDDFRKRHRQHGRIGCRRQGDCHQPRHEPGSDGHDGERRQLFAAVSSSGQLQGGNQRHRLQEVRPDRHHAGRQPQCAGGRGAAGRCDHGNGGGERRRIDGGDFGAGTRPDHYQHGNRQPSAGESRHLYAAQPDGRCGYHRPGHRQFRRADAGNGGQRIAQLRYRLGELQPERRQQHQRPAQYRQFRAESGRHPGIPRAHQQLPGGRRTLRRGHRHDDQQVAGPTSCTARSSSFCATTS